MKLACQDKGLHKGLAHPSRRARIEAGFWQKRNRLVRIVISARPGRLDWGFEGWSQRRRKRVANSRRLKATADGPVVEAA
jgi:hypothetical protein